LNGCQAKTFFASARAMCDDEDFRALLRNWDKIAEVTSMAVERLLARTKHASEQLQTPTAERFSANGFNSEWLHEHIAVGGRNPKVTRIQDLIKDHNAPLTANNKPKSTNSSLARGGFLYADEKYDELKRRTRQKYSLDQYYILRNRYLAEFDLKSAAEKADFNRRASTPGGRHEQGAAGDVPEARAFNMDGALFGINSQALPVNPDFATDLLEELVGRVGGLTSYADKMRDLFMKRLFVKDEGLIPKAWKNTWRDHEQCGIKHPGLCADRDRDIFDDAMRIVKALRVFVKGGGGDATQVLRIYFLIAASKL
jgi:hypothetical protein